MRKSKFKGLSLRREYWAEGVPHAYGDGEFICPHLLMNNDGRDWRAPAIEVRPGSICQFSGVLDKKKVEIYEADILRGDDEDFPDEPPYFGICTFYQGKFGFVEGMNGERINYSQEEIPALIKSGKIYFNGFFDVLDYITWEVVGNTNKPE